MSTETLLAIVDDIDADAGTGWVVWVGECIGDLLEEHESPHSKTALVYVVPTGASADQRIDLGRCEARSLWELVA
jgi:hypothetical protein